MRKLAALMFLLASIVPPVAGVGQEPQTASALVRGNWTVTPLVPLLSPVPGAPDQLFQNFTGTLDYVTALRKGILDPQTYAVTDDGMVVFWVALGDKSVIEQRARARELNKQTESERESIEKLLQRMGIADKTLKWTLCSLRGGTVKTIAADEARFRAPDGGERSIKLVTNRIVPSKNRAFIRVEKGNSLWGYFGWNGDAFDTFIQPNETFTAEGQTFTIKTVYDMGRTASGDLWVLVDLKERPDRQFICVWSDPKVLVPMLAGGAPNPIVNGRTFGGRFLEPQGRRFGGLMLTPQWVDAAGPAQFSAFFYVKRSFVEGFPADLTFTLHRDGQYQNLLDYKASDLKIDLQKKLVVERGHFLGASPPLYVFAAGNQNVRREGSMLIFFDSLRMYVSSGGPAKLVADDLLLDPDSIREIRTPRGSILSCRAKKEPTLVSLTVDRSGKVTAANEAGGTPYEPYVLEVAGSTVALRPAPPISTPGSKDSFLLSDVVGWINENEMVAILPAGLFLLRRVL